MKWRSVVLPAFLVLVSVTVVATCLAQTGKTEQPKTMSYSGDVVSVNTKANTITVKGNEGEKTFNISGATWTGYNSVSEVKTGDSVTVDYVQKGKQMVATSVKASLTTRMKDEAKQLEKKIKPEDKK